MERFVLRALAERGFFVIRYDHRDIGESSVVDWKTSPYGLLELAEDALGILDAYGIEQAYFVGHSMGGYVCQTIAVEFPKRTLGIAIIGAGPIGSTDETELPLSEKEKKILEKTWEIFLHRKDGDTVEATIRSFLPVWRHLNGTYPLDEELAQAYTHDLFTRSPGQIHPGNNHEQVMRHLEIGKHKGILKKIRVPTLIIHGELDPLSLPRNGKALAHAIPKAKLVVVPGMGHMFFDRVLEAKLVDILANQMR